ncbi:MAG: hypothetical protein ACI37Q_07250 [Candidatus Gastranaerophilaceae bacterium]
MSVSSFVVKGFNKNGFRLLCKESGALEKLLAKNSHLKGIPQKATIYDYVCIESKDGIQQKILSFKDSNGKLIQRRRFNVHGEQYSISDYIWQKPVQIDDLELLAFKRKTDKNVLENFGLIVDTNTSGNGKYFDKISREVVDINPSSRTVTRTVDHRTKDITPVGVESAYTDEITLSEIVKGKKTKEIYQKSHSLRNEENRIVETRSIGLTDEEIKDLTDDEYFFAKFKPVNEAIKAAAPHAICKRAGKILPVKIDPNAKFSSYSPASERVTIKTRPTMTKSGIFEALEHEGRHHWQKELTKKLEAGKLTDPQEIKMAEEFRKNRQNYISLDQSDIKIIEMYERQPLEADAYNISNEVITSRRKILDKIKSIFTKARNTTLGY